MESSRRTGIIAAERHMMEPVQSSEEMPCIQRTSVIILNFNAAEHLPDCLSSLSELNFPADKMELIIVDNASTDGSVSWIRQHYPGARLVVNSSNLGFAAGINRGAAASSGSYLAFLNPDMRVDRDWLLNLWRVMSTNAEVACVGSVVLNWTGDKVDYSGRPEDALNLCPSPPQNTNDVLGCLDDSPLLFASGGAMLVRRDVFLELGGFDEDYFLYNEDVDLGWRLWSRGYEVLRSTKSLVFHKGGASSQRLSPEVVLCQAQKYALYTVLKNMQDDHLREILPGVLWFLVDRTRWFTSARLSLGQAVQELASELDTVWEKRASIQSERARGDSEIFARCGHPFGFLLANPDLVKFRRYLSEVSGLTAPATEDATAVGGYVMAVLWHAYRFTYGQVPGEISSMLEPGASKFEEARLSTRFPPSANDEDSRAYASSGPLPRLAIWVNRISLLARRVLPMRWRQRLAPLWHRLNGRAISDAIPRQIK